MKKIFLMAAAILSLASCAQENLCNLDSNRDLTPAQLLQKKLVKPHSNDIIGGSVLVRLYNSDENTIKQFTEKATNTIAATAVTPLFGSEVKNPEAAARHGLNRWFSVSFGETVRPEVMAEKLAGLAEVEKVEFEVRLGQPETGTVVPCGDEMVIATRDVDLTPKLPFNDPLLPQQWNLNNDGSINGSVAGADVGIFDAWTLETGSKDIIVAVIDDGVKFLHKDLKDAMWVNDAEKTGKPGVDDDGNGFIDDIYGFNFINTTNVGTTDKPSWKMSNMHPLNPNKGTGHGTHVAGIIGAVNNNGEGVASIAGGNDGKGGVRIMTCQVYEGDVASAGTSGRAMAFRYAADNGACVANCSFGLKGGHFTSDDAYREENGVEYDAMQYFIDPANANCKAVDGNIIVASAGNESAPYASYPSALPFVISASAYGPDYRPGGYCNWGPGCKVAAPGGDMDMSDMHNLDKNNTMVLSLGCTELESGSGLYGKNYVWMQGTSMAAPHVSAIAALGMSYAEKIGKHYSREDFISILMSSVNDINPYLKGTKPFTTKGGLKHFDVSRYRNNMGSGAIDAWKVLMNIEGTPSYLIQSGKPVSLKVSDIFGANVHITEHAFSDGAIDRLGISGFKITPAGEIVFSCSKVGSCKLRLTAQLTPSAVTRLSGVAGDRTDGITDKTFTREISIACRNLPVSNGGWF